VIGVRVTADSGLTGPFGRLGALTLLTITNTVLIFVLLPLAIALVIAGLTVAGGTGRKARRYRPGRPYDFTPIWFLSSPEQISTAAAPTAQAPAIESGVVETGGRVPLGATGGASDRW
jgi:hypothetical protein